MVQSWKPAFSFFFYGGGAMPEPDRLSVLMGEIYIADSELRLTGYCRV